MSHWNIYNKRSDVPASCGVYVLYENGSILYIGASKDIRKRFSNHRVKEWDTVKIKPMGTFGAAHTLEEKLIAKLDPPFNSHGSRRVELSTRHRVTIDHELYKKVRDFCINNGFKITDFVNEMLNNVFKGIEDAKQIKN